jgi:2-succinyl-5-enolpyruvyl-6-hydroxy-3-cyclohexene-1-carboxylate synthase
LIEIIEGAPAKVLNAIASQLPPAQGGGEWLALWRTANSTAEGQLGALCDDGFWEGSIARSVMKSLPDNTMLHVASSMPIRDLCSFGGASRRDLTIYSSRGANGIDGTIATALGEAHIHDGPAILMCGDLAFLHDIGSLVTSRNTGSGLIVLVIDNNGGGIFHALPISSHEKVFEQLFVTPQGVDIGALCDGIGIDNVEVSSTSELELALQKAVGSPKGRGGVRVITAKVSRAFSVKQRDNAFTAVNSALGQISEGGL